MEQQSGPFVLLFCTSWNCKSTYGFSAAAIGLGGIQLFVDAGVPVDRHLVSELIKDVVAEKIATLLGYPKPTAAHMQDQVSKFFP